jgi:hypothetical protein
VAVEALDERAAVGVTELVRDDVRRQAALHQHRRTGVAKLVQLELVALAPALTDDAEGVRQRALRQSVPASRVEQVRAVEARRDVGQRDQRRWRDRDHRRLSILGALLPALAVDREPDRALGALHVDVGATDAAGLARTTADVSEEQDQRAELGAVATKRRHGCVGELGDTRLGQRVQIVTALPRLQSQVGERVDKVSPSRAASPNMVRATRAVFVGR